MIAALLLAAACSREEAKQTATNAKNSAKRVVNRAADALNAEAPYERTAPTDTAAIAKAREQERLDQQWRQLQSFRAQQAAAAQQQQQQAEAAAQAAAAQQQAAAATANIQFVKWKKEGLKGLNPEAVNAAPVGVPITGDVAGPSVLKTQVYLDRADFSVGPLDGRWGKNSAIAVWWFQREHGLPQTGEVDEATFRALAAGGGAAPVLKTYQLTADDTKGPFVTIPSDVYDKEKLDCLCYESLREELAEKFHTTEDFLEILNPGVKFSGLQPGDSIVVPNVREPLTTDRPDVAKVVISVAGNTFNAFDAAGRLVFHAPTTLGNKYDPSPNETVKVVGIAHDPNFHYQPTLFHEVPDSDPEAHLKPGPNSPVGVVWMALSKPHFGVHGTSDPDSIGYASSHGCVRLTNWDALEVSHRITRGVPVEFVDTRKGQGATAE
ncbi:MAG: murein L,D-transpeptidase [Acidobacteria bacterium]|nr:murein L,D-transpeptidase [Acidobacteriota bacterium]